MKPVLLAVRFRALLRAFPKEVRAEAGRHITEVQTAFGDPHRHAGLGIRKLSRRHYEIRAHLDVRLVFTADEPESLRARGSALDVFTRFRRRRTETSHKTLLC